MATKKEKTTKKKTKRKLKRRIIEEYVEDPDELGGDVPEETIEKTDEKPKGKMYVGFWRRFFAAIIDTIATSITIGIMWIVHMYTEPKKGWTIGKYLLGIRVVKEETMKPAGFVSNLLLRGLAGKGIADMLTLGIGCLWLIIDKKKQALHDKIAGTVVVYKEYMKE